MAAAQPLLSVDACGLCCASGGFHVDPWKPVPHALITHGHGDHARPGSRRYWTAASGVPILRRRLGEAAKVEAVPYGEPRRLGGVTVSFHPAGHVLGSAQIRVERDGLVWVVSGDYKRQADATCEAFTPIACDTFVSEATFALPIYRWDDTALVARQLFDWWEENRAAERASVLFCYALGKAQRLLGALTGLTDRTVFVHSAIEPLVACYRQAGAAMLPTLPVGDKKKGVSFAGELVLAPPSAVGTPWMRRFGGAGTGFASGWMRLRGKRRRRGFDRGFVLSDHADWPDLLRTIRETGARRVLTTHGYAEPLARYLTESGLESRPLATQGSRAEGVANDAD